MSATSVGSGIADLRPRSPWRRALLVWQAPIAVVLMVLAVLAHRAVPALIGAAYLAAVTPELVRIDLAEHRLPDALTLPGFAAALAGAAGGAAMGQPILPILAAAAAVLVLFLLLALGGGMGLGDVKLAGALALVLGALGAPAVLLALVGAFLPGGLGALLLLARSGRSERLPFGPFLLAGFWVAL